jgi:hypothetical protein
MPSRAVVQNAIVFSKHQCTILEYSSDTLASCTRYRVDALMDREMYWIIQIRARAEVRTTLDLASDSTANFTIQKIDLILRCDTVSHHHKTVYTAPSYTCCQTTSPNTRHA